MSIAARSHYRGIVAAAVCVAGAAAALMPARPAETTQPPRPLDLREIAARARERAGPLRIQAFPLDGGVDLEMTPFRVTTAGTRFVLAGGPAGDREPVGFDPNDVVLLSGRIAGDPVDTSRAYLALWRDRVLGYVQRDRRWFEVSAAADADGTPRLSVAPAVARTAPLRVPFCTVEGAPGDLAEPLSVASAPQRGSMTIELAVDSDYEFYSLFADGDEAAFYVTALYGAIDDIYRRDLNAHVVLTFVRLWDDPNDLYNDPNPLLAFLQHWSTQMGGVHRDTAQLLTGRRDIPFTGSAWQSSACGGLAYSAAGFLNGTSLGSRGLDRWDLVLAAHELGHTCGAQHTHSLGVDACVPTPGVERRGTIMSYCSVQNGGIANIDLRFHTVVQSGVKVYLDSAACIADDCNLNNVADLLDLAGGTSADLNGNAVPDECEDCNYNGVLDDGDIAAGTSLDLDANGIPDECEPDCNGNGVPDAADLAALVSLDANGNNVPDECESDCDMNSVPDFVQIQANMDLDVDRNGRLDDCDDCDGDGIPDRQALAGANHLWVAGAAMPALRAYHPVNGARAGLTQGSVLQQAQDLLAAADGRLLVAVGGEHRVAQFDAVSGTFLGDLVPAGGGGLSFPTGMVRGPDGRLYVASRDNDRVLYYDINTGDFLGTFVAAGAGGLRSPYGLAFGPDGDLYVCSDGTNAVLQYDGLSGAFRRAFVAKGASPLTQPRGLTFKADGRLLVADVSLGAILEYAHDTGYYLGVFAKTASQKNPPAGPWAVHVGPNGHVYAAARDFPEVYEFSAATGAYLRSLVVGPYSGLAAPTGLVFAPDPGVDCNVNGVPDNCDIAEGFSSDANLNVVPDECEADCNANGLDDRREVVPFGTQYDCNFNGVLDSCELAAGSAADCDGNGILDACEPDCNGNGVPDPCDLAGGTSANCNSNGVPDECEPPADCNSNGVWDGCELAAADCNTSGVLDQCELAAGTSSDFDGDLFLDECDDDIDNDGIPNELDTCDFTPPGAVITNRGGPPGDVDGDCVVTTLDYFYFAFCLDDSGPNDPPVFSDCLVIFDFDADGDVDLFDYGGFQRAMRDSQP